MIEERSCSEVRIFSYSLYFGSLSLMSIEAEWCQWFWTLDVGIASRRHASWTISPSHYGLPC